MSSLCCTQPRQCVLSQPVANTHSRSVTSTKSTNIRAARQWERFRATPNMVVFNDFFLKSTSRYNLVHFADLIFQKCSERHIFFNSFEGEIELLLECGAHFADLIFQKCSERQSFFRTVLKSISSSRHSPVHSLTITSPDQDPKPQKPVS